MVQLKYAVAAVTQAVKQVICGSIPAVMSPKLGSCSNEQVAVCMNPSAIRI